MKTTKFLVAALALFSFLSCQKEELQNPTIDEGIIVTCTFANNDAATKTTTTDGKTPLWAAGDKIMLYNGGTDTKELTLYAIDSGEEEGFAKGIISADSKSFSFKKPSTGWDILYAIYPSGACVKDSKTPKFNFEDQDGTFGKANICAAKEITGAMSFKNVGAILKFTKNTSNVTDIFISVAGQANDYNVTFSGENPELVSENATNSRSYSISNPNVTMYFGVPQSSDAGVGAQKVVYFPQDNTKAILGSDTTTNEKTIVKNTIYNMGDIEGVGTSNIPQGMLPKAFSVSPTKKVYFSKGNLQADIDATGAPTLWKFATNQYDYVGTNQNSIIGSEPGTVDVFGWSSSISNYGIKTTKDTSVNYYGTFVDWGKNPISNGGNAANLWSTLTGDEWAYLLDSASRSNNRFVYANVNGTNGLIIFPDVYTGTPSATGIATEFNVCEAFPSSPMSKDEWLVMQSDGCVFLPAAGWRNGSNLKDINAMGRYWSSTSIDIEKAYIMLFWSGEFFAKQPDHGKYCNGISVRLVSPAQ